LHIELRFGVNPRQEAGMRGIDAGKDGKREQ
jgi:hypothetical protein